MLSFVLHSALNEISLVKNDVAVFCPFIVLDFQWTFTQDMTETNGNCKKDTNIKELLFHW